MSNYDNTNSGAAFERDNANPKAPKYSGPLNVEGKDFEISIWEKTSKAGSNFLSIKVGPPREKKGGSGNKSFTQKPKPNTYSEEEIPF
jgi:uncharacterized protein (DUF736 family)